MPSIASTSARLGTPASAPSRVQLTAAAALAKRSVLLERPAGEPAVDEAGAEDVAGPGGVDRVDVERR